MLRGLLILSSTQWQQGGKRIKRGPCQQLRYHVEKVPTITPFCLDRRAWMIRTCAFHMTRSEMPMASDVESEVSFVCLSSLCSGHEQLFPCHESIQKTLQQCMSQPPVGVPHIPNVVFYSKQPFSQLLECFLHRWCVAASPIQSLLAPGRANAFHHLKLQSGISGASHQIHQHGSSVDNGGGFRPSLRPYL